MAGGGGSRFCGGELCFFASADYDDDDFAHVLCDSDPTP